MSFRYSRRVLLEVDIIAAIAAVAVGTGTTGSPGDARLVAFEPMSAFGAAETCEWDAAVAQPPRISYATASVALQSPSTSARQRIATRAPLAFVQDPYPSFSSVAVDTVRNEVVVTDENRFRIMTYARTATTPANAGATTPKRVIAGLHTHTQYASEPSAAEPVSGESRSG